MIAHARAVDEGYRYSLESRPMYLPLPTFRKVQPLVVLPAVQEIASTSTEEPRVKVLSSFTVTATALR